MEAIKEILKDLLNFIITSSYIIINIYTYFIFVGIFCIDQKQFEDVYVIIYFIVYHVLLGISLMMYLRVQSVEDYSTKEIFPILSSDAEEVNLRNTNPFFAMEIEENRSKTLNVCTECRAYKPPRSHHCSTCNKCYLKFDHHCKVFSTCIFFQKYKFFFQFLVYNSIFLIFTISVFLIEILKNPYRTLFLVNYIINVVFLLIMAIYTLVLLAMHFFLISNNETTVEFYALNTYLTGDNSYTKIFQEGPIVTKSNSRNRSFLNPYNLSLRKNWAEVFGDNVYGWVLPIFTSKGNGVAFPKNDFEDELNY